MNNKLLRFVKNNTLPLSMLTGILGYQVLEKLDFITPYLIFLMLVVSYSKIPIKTLIFKPFHLLLILCQLFISWALYFLLKPFDEVIAQGAFVCALAPTAAAASVIIGMLGGSVSTLATYCLFSNFTVAILSPIFFSIISPQQDHTSIMTALLICKKVVPLLILPFVVSIFIEQKMARFHQFLVRRQSISYYLWALALTIVFARTISFLLIQGRSTFRDVIWLAVIALVVCLLQFGVGRFVGRRYDETIAGGQGLGQKNTILGIWMAQSFLNPLASIAPAAYVLWQNIINSWQLWKRRKCNKEDIKQ